MSSGILRVQSFTARLAAPLPYTDITVTGSGFSYAFTTDDSGNAPDLTLPAPSKEYSLQQSNTTQMPYGVCTITAGKNGWRTLTIADVEIFDGQVTLAQLELQPAGQGGLSGSEEVQVPVHALFSGEGGSGPAPTAAELPDPSLILREVLIPQRITVHLGRPAASAQNVTVSFRHYIANVASSEVYPTWVGQQKSRELL